MTLKQKIVTGMLLASTAGMLGGTAVEIYKNNRLEDTIRERLELSDETRVTMPMIEQFPNLKEKYEDRSDSYKLIIPALALYIFGVAGLPFRGVPGWAGSYRNKENG